MHRHLADEAAVDLAHADKFPRVSEVHDLRGTLDESSDHQSADKDSSTG